ncbi:MAG: NUDIX domain-containing protein [Candidatus Paceibacterota bacterium]
MLKVDFYNLGEIKDSDLSFSVITAIHNSKWVFTKHRKRDTWETPGGKRNESESIDECASRELIEETGADKFSLIPLCIYSVEKEDKKDFGQIYYSEIDNFNELPDFEMEKIEFFDKLPDKLTHPLIESLIFKKVLEILGK